jgi:thiamine-monophosphate kinase
MDIVEGVTDCCESVSAKYLGGDTKECPELTIAGTSLGLVRTDGVLKRSGANEGDLLAMTGTVGLAGAAFHEIDLDDHDPKARRAALEPRPRIREGVLLSASGCVTSCMDTSDGLAMSVHELSNASGVGFEVMRSKVPVDPAAVAICEKHGKPIDDAALYSGGDYQLLFTIDPSGLGRLASMMKDDITVIGRATKERDVVLIGDGGKVPLPNKGYEHFKG